MALTEPETPLGNYHWEWVEISDPSYDTFVSSKLYRLILNYYSLKTHTHNVNSITDTNAHGNLNTSSGANQATINNAIDTVLGTKANSVHNHSGTYASASHTHDDRYYTESEIDTKISNISTWTSRAVTNYGTLYINSALRLCEFKYARAFSNITAGYNQQLHTGSVPEAYRPLSQAQGVGHMANSTIRVDTSGNIHIRFYNALSSGTVHFQCMWHY